MSDDNILNFTPKKSGTECHGCGEVHPLMYPACPNCSTEHHPVFVHPLIDLTGDHPIIVAMQCAFCNMTVEVVDGVPAG